MSLLLSDYGLIGNRASAALVSRVGSIDWCCLPYLDSPGHFAALLDVHRGGRFQLAPQGDFRSEQRYLQRTQVLETTFETANGRATLTDWMPMGPLETEPMIFRRLEVVDGRVAWQLTCTPRFDNGAHTAQAEYHRGGVLFRGHHPGTLARLHASDGIEVSQTGASAVARFGLEAGAVREFAWAWGRRAGIPAAPVETTLEAWREIAHRCPSEGCLFAGPWHDAVARGALNLKILAARYSGALSEGVTASLTSVRDLAPAMQALENLGYEEDADAMFGFFSDLLVRDGAEGLQPAYSLDGGRALPEREVARASRQFQLDIYGHALVAAGERLLRLRESPEFLWTPIQEIADYVCQAWRRPDQGPWESRARPEHFVASKLLCWAGLDRAIRVARAHGRPVPVRWEEERRILHRAICEQGFDGQRRSFVRAFGSSELDASVLLIATTGFLPPDDPRVLGTLAAVQDELSEGVLVHRLSARQRGDGAATEGAHLGSSFLLVCCLALAGRADEASDRLAELCTYCSPLGLFGEFVDPRSGETSGVFPCASATIAMINAALYVGMARGRRLAHPPLLFGLPEPRAAGHAPKSA
jgi:GH15 family glucan-1,4-alpha-glucosidase